MSYTSMQVAVDSLNIRRQPKVADNIVRTARRDEVLNVDKDTLTANGFVQIDTGLWTSWQYLRPAIPPPPGTGEFITVYTTDNLNVRSGPGTNFNPPLRVIGANTPVQVLALSGPDWWRLDTSDPQWIAKRYTTISPPGPIIVPPPGWALPFSASLRGVHGDAGGWGPTAVDLDLVRRNSIKVVFQVAYNAGVAGRAIPAYRSAGVQHFITRASLSGLPPDAQDFIARTLPILSEYATALGGSNGMMIAIHNEPNLISEGLNKEWRNGTEFAAWWHTVAAAYRAALPGCKLGFPALSPGGDVSGIRQNEITFLQQARSAVLAADWIGVHCYWIKPDGSDFAPPILTWKQWFGTKPIVGTEIGPVLPGVVTNEAVRAAYAKLTAAGIPCMAWILDGTETFNEAAWNKHNIAV